MNEFLDGSTIVGSCSVLFFMCRSLILSFKNLFMCVNLFGVWFLLFGMMNFVCFVDLIFDLSK